MGAAWERHGVCELAFKIHFSIMLHIGLHKFILLEDVEGKSKLGYKFVVNRTW
jgi:hypothetical protein